MNEPVHPSPIWREDFKVRSYEVDFLRRATLDALCRRFLEAAWNHAEALGVGYSHLAAEGRMWVLSRLLIHLSQYPAWGETVRLETWPRAAKPLLAMRDFEMLNQAGTRLIAGCSAWVVLDSRTHRPQRIENLLSHLRSPSDRRAVDRDPEKVPAPVAATCSFTTAVRYTDVDANLHVNSSRYIGWLLDAYDMDHHREHEVGALEINYLGETRAGDTVLVSTESIGPSEFGHTIETSNGNEVCRARIAWNKRSAQ